MITVYNEIFYDCIKWRCSNMKFKSVTIKNFRNFEDISIELTNKNVLFGMNDVGKTNFLYALRFVFDKDIRKQNFNDTDYFKKKVEFPIEITIEIDISDIENTDSQKLRAKLKGALLSNQNTVYIKVKASYDEKEMVGIPVMYWGGELEDLEEMKVRGTYYEIDYVFNVTYIDAYVDLYTLFKKNANKLLVNDKEEDKDMAVNRVPVLKRCRSLGMDPVYLGIDKKSNRQLKRSNRKMSEYGLQLREKQKAKFIYGVLEKPFLNYFKKADQMSGMTGENLMVLLESRLDNVVFRLGFARTRREARQIVDHKQVLVNGKQVNIPSYLIKAGDVIEIKEGKKSSQRYKDIVEVTGGRLVPEWLESDIENLKGTVKELPTREAIDVPVDEMMIVELYSK